MRFLHTADWHIGLKARHLGGAGEKAREERLATASHIAELARAEHVDFVLVAGDTFDSPDVRPQWVLQTAEILRSMDCPVFVLPGNHDPDVPAGLWSHPIWQSNRNIHVCRSGTQLEIPGGTLYPCPVKSRWQSNVPTEWIPRRTSGDVVRIAMAHAGIVTPAAPGLSGAIPPGIAEELGLDYIALGDWHSTTAALDTRIAHSGTPEATAFDERDSGNVLLVTIDAAGAMPRIEKRRVARLEWVQLERRLGSNGDAHSLLNDVRAIATTLRLLEVKVSGIINASDATTLEEIERVLGDEFLYGRLRRESLISGDTDVALPLGFVTEAATRLARQAENGDPAASQALMELARIAREVGA